MTHLVFTVFGLMTNILVTAMLLTGGSAVVTSLTGMHTAAACFLLPLGVVVYTMFGGIKATFLTVRHIPSYSQAVSNSSLGLCAYRHASYHHLHFRLHRLCDQ
jgi:hypothetical protein